MPDKPAIVTKKSLLAVWVALVILTVITIKVAQVHLGFGNVLAALTLATIKASLVILFFMDLRHEGGLFIIIFFVALAVLSIFIGLTYFDIGYRY